MVLHRPDGLADSLPRAYKSGLTDIKKRPQAWRAWGL